MLLTKHSDLIFANGLKLTSHNKQFHETQHERTEGIRPLTRYLNEIEKTEHALRAIVNMTKKTNKQTNPMKTESGNVRLIMT